MKKEEELKIGDIVIITSSSNVFTIGLLLGYKTLTLKIFYKIDVILKECCLDMDYFKERMNLALKRAQNIENIEIKEDSLIQVSKVKQCKKITSLDADIVKAWYLKNKILNNTLLELYEKDELVKHNEKQEIGLGSVFKTPVSNIYYIYTGIGTKYAKLDEMNYELLKCYNLLGNPDIVDRLNVNRMLLLADRVDETIMQQVLSRLKH